MDINVHLFHCFANFLIKKLQEEQLKMKLFVMKNQQKNYAKTSIRKFKKRNVHSSFIDNIWVADFKGFRFFLCVIDIYRKYAWVIPLKDTK